MAKFTEENTKKLLKDICEADNIIKKLDDKILVYKDNIRINKEEHNCTITKLQTKICDKNIFIEKLENIILEKNKVIDNNTINIKTLDNKINEIYNEYKNNKEDLIKIKKKYDKLVIKYNILWKIL